MSRSTSLSSTFLAYALWLGLSGLAAWLLWTLYGVLMLGATLWLSGELPRPSGWTIRTSVAISKMLILILGSFWLGYCLWMEREASAAAGKGNAARWGLRRGIWLAGILAGLYGLAFLLGNFSTGGV